MDITSILTSAFALLFVLSLIFIASILLRKYGSGRVFVDNPDKKKRLSVKDTLIIDSKRKLVLISRDDVEHLILLSHENETIIEGNINNAEIEDMDSEISSKEALTDRVVKVGNKSS